MQASLVLVLKEPTAKPVKQSREDLIKINDLQPSAIALIIKRYIIGFWLVSWTAWQIEFKMDRRSVKDINKLSLFKAWRFTNVRKGRSHVSPLLRPKESNLENSPSGLSRGLTLESKNFGFQNTTEWKPKRNNIRDAAYFRYVFKEYPNPTTIEKQSLRQKERILMGKLKKQTTTWSMRIYCKLKLDAETSSKL